MKEASPPHVDCGGDDRAEDQARMPREELENLWNRVLVRLKDSVPASQIDGYLKTARLGPGEGTDLELEFPDRFVRDAVEKHRLDGLIRQALEAEGEPRPLKLRVRSKARRKDQGSDPAQNRLDFLVEPAPGRSGAELPAFPVNLNPKYTLRSFVVGEGNRIAYTICETVAQSPGKVYNPVFIYGGVGLGKTHLMQAVGHAMLDVNPRARVRYVPSEVFTNEYIQAIKEKTTEQFRKSHRELDLLLIDDVQFFGNKEGLQEEFFHTFNEYYQAGKQIILTSDRSPKQLAGMQERLVSRFEQGLVTDVRAPNVETRTAILLNLAQSAGLSFGAGTLELLAERIRSNVRILEGAFNKVLVLCSIQRQPVTREIIEEVLREHGGEPVEAKRTIDLALIQELVAEYYRITVADLKGRRRTQDVVLPRQVGMFLAHELTEETLESVAKAFGKKDHTTAIHALAKVRSMIGKSPDLDTALRVLRKRLKTVVDEA